MKKLLACGAALSLMLLACGDDSSSGPDPVTGGETIESSDSVVGSSGAQAAASSAEEATSSAEVATSSAGGTAPESSAAVPESSSSVIASKQEATDVVAQCGDGLDENAPVDVEIVDGPGGTPPVAYAYIGDDGFITYVVESMMLSCGIALEGIASSAEEATPESSSATIPESSATTLEESQLKAAGYYRGQCLKDDFSEMMPVKDAPAPEELPYATLRYASDGQAIVELNKVMDYCDIDAKVSQKVNGDTLFVDYYDMGAVSKCVCTFDIIEFAIDEENTRVQYFSFGSTLYRLQGPVVVD